MDLLNTKADIEAEKKRIEAKYGIQIKNEEQFFQVQKERRTTNIIVILVISLLILILGALCGFGIGYHVGLKVASWSPPSWGFMP